ncbi:MAG: hypothetical protein KIS66_06915 [Fimbriimonadaceae bacterium]|nr:hypothetical protein [Fimbriimonadaceae bacterium]
MRRFRSVLFISVLIAASVISCRGTVQQEAHFAYPDWDGPGQHGPLGAPLYSDRWKLNWANDLLYAYDPGAIPEDPGRRAAFSEYDAPPVRNLLFEAALGCSIVPPGERSVSWIHISIAVGKVGRADVGYLKRFLKLCRDPGMSGWAIRTYVVDNDATTDAIVEEALAIQGATHRVDLQVAWYLRSVYRTDIPEGVKRRLKPSLLAAMRELDGGLYP